MAAELSAHPELPIVSTPLSEPRGTLLQRESPWKKGGTPISILPKIGSPPCPEIGRFQNQSASILIKTRQKVTLRFLFRIPVAQQMTPFRIKRKNDPQ